MTPFGRKKEGRKPWYKKRNDNRGFTTMINRYKADHYNLNDSLGRKGTIHTEKYDCGAEKEDLNHVVYNCQLYEEEREYMFRKMDKLKKKIEFNIDRVTKNEE